MDVIREIFTYIFLVAFMLGLPAFLVGLFTRFTKK